MNRLLAASICVLGLVAAEEPAHAHVLDEYLQTAFVALTPGGPRVELLLTPGAEVEGRVFALIDGDGDGAISASEGAAYAERVLGDVSLDLDGRRTPLAVERAQFPSRDEMRQGVGVVRVDLAADVPLKGAGAHRLTFRNDHLPQIGEYLANVLVPDGDSIAITGQARDRLQRELRVGFRVATTRAERIGWGLAMGVAFAMLASGARGAAKRRRCESLLR